MEKTGDPKSIRIPTDLEEYIEAAKEAACRGFNEQLFYYCLIGIGVERELGKEAADRLLKNSNLKTRL